MTSRKNINSILAGFSGGGIVAIPRPYIELTGGDVTAALFLSQLVYWSNKLPGSGGWVHKTYAEWYTELGLSRYRIDRSSKKLEDLKVIERSLRKKGNHPVIHYRVDFKTLISLIFAEDETMPIEDEETDEEFFARKERERPPQVKTPHDPEEIRQNVLKAVEGYQARMVKDQQSETIENYLATVQEHIRPLAEAFCYGFGRRPLKSENSFWRKGWLEQFSIGLTADDVTEAIRVMREKNLYIKSPRSVTNVANEIHMHKKTRTKKESGETVYMSEAAKRLLDRPPGKGTS